MLSRYVVADILRNPRRTLSTVAGVVLGVGLFCGVLFFIDGLSASMTQRAVAPVAIDMQRIVTERVGNEVVLTQHLQTGRLGPGERAVLRLELRNGGAFPANEVTVRSAPAPGLRYVAGSATVDGQPVGGFAENPFSHGPVQAGLNVGTIEPGAVHQLEYAVESVGGRVTSPSAQSSFSTRESVSPTAANRPALVELQSLAQGIRKVDGVAAADTLSIADLGSAALSTGSQVAPGATKIFGFDSGYTRHDSTVKVVSGRLGGRRAVVSVEAANALGVRVGDRVRVQLPDGTKMTVRIGATADLSQARSLFSSRRGGDLETFAYSPNAVVVPSAQFARQVFPAYERAATLRDQRLKNPPIREVDIKLDRHLLAADPATAVHETERVGREVSAVAAHQDYLLDNISNALAVAADDAAAAKRLFVFLGVPGALLAAALAGYAGNVLAEAQRREQATLRVRGASRRHLLRMLALRTMLLTAAGAGLGLIAGYLAAAAILGQDSLELASTSSLVVSGVAGAAAGFFATGLALYVTGRRSIDREINEDRARLAGRAPLWRRAGLDVVGAVVVVVGTTVALSRHAFDGEAGSVYFGRAVKLDLALLVLPVMVWIAGCLFFARLLGSGLRRSAPRSSGGLGRAVPSLFRRSIGRRAWAVGNGVIVVALIVALAASLAAFTSSYDLAKFSDARFANGSDIRITPTPRAGASYPASAAARFHTTGVAVATPVVFQLSNVILRSQRTSDPGNLAAVDPAGFRAVAPLRDRHFANGDAKRVLDTIAKDRHAVFLSTDMAEFLQLVPGDAVFVLLARSTENQVEVPMRVAGLFERLPGFPEGADALMSIEEHLARVPAKRPDFFLARTTDSSSATLHRAMKALEVGPGSAGDLRFDTRETTLARDQSSLAALNVAGLVDLDSGYALAMAVVAIAIFVFGLLLARRREYVTLRAQGLESGGLRRLITAEAATVAVAGAVAGVLVGTAMGYYFVRVLRPLFVLPPRYSLPFADLTIPVGIVVVATLAASMIAAWMVQRLEPTELLRDE